MATTIASTAPISANHPDSTALWASLSRIVNHPPKQKRGIFTELFAHLARMRYFCGAFHLNRATVSPTASAAGLFYGRGVCHNTSSVPCGALMRPLPGSRWKATGSGTFFVALLEEISTQFHSLNKLSKMNTATITLPAASGRRSTPAATRLTAAVRNLIHRMYARAHARRHDPGPFGPQPLLSRERR